MDVDGDHGQNGGTSAYRAVDLFLCRYGGAVFGAALDALFDKFRVALKAQGLNEGADWRFTYLKPSHPLYHSFFDFDMAVRDNQKLRAHVGDMGLLIGDRLAVFITGAREVVTQSAKVGTGNFQVAVDGRRHLQFTINTIVFALTQEGGVTQQLMARVE